MLIELEERGLPTQSLCTFALRVVKLEVFLFFSLKTNPSDILLNGQNLILMLERVQFIDIFCRSYFKL